MFSSRILNRLFSNLALVLGLCVLAACRVEVGKARNPIPTPTPTPTPTPVARASLLFDPAGATAPPSPSARAATGAADYLEGVTAEAAEQTVAARRTLARALEAPSSAGSQVRLARTLLSEAAVAYAKAEASVFLVDPGSPAELRAQPDPLCAGTPDGRDETIAELSASLEKMDKLLQRPLGRDYAAALLAEAQNAGPKIAKLEAGLRELADAWRQDNGANFRREFFLRSSEDAVARVYQGLLAMTSDVLPQMLEDADASPEEISARLAGVRELYLGDPGAEQDNPSLHLLVARVAPLQAALTRASIARSSALAGVLEITPENQALRSELATSLQDVTRQLTLAAQSTGITIVDVP